MAERKAKRAWGGRRKGAGRPQVVDEAADRTVRFERRDLEALHALAAERGATVGDLIREAVAQYLARHRRR